MDLTWRNVWFESKALIERELGMSKDLMHVHFGLGLFLALRRAFVEPSQRHTARLEHRGGPAGVERTSSCPGWINWTGSLNWSDTVKDFGTTLFWPTVLLLSWRWIGPKR
jgi:hypothetical protein